MCETDKQQYSTKGSFEEVSFSSDEDEQLKSLLMNCSLDEDAEISNEN
jgi:hypothetical protein